MNWLVNKMIKLEKITATLEIIRPVREKSSELSDKEDADDIVSSLLDGYGFPSNFGVTATITKREPATVDDFTDTRFWEIEFWEMEKQNDTP